MYGGCVAKQSASVFTAAAVVAFAFSCACTCAWKDLKLAPKVLHIIYIHLLHVHDCGTCRKKHFCTQTADNRSLYMTRRCKAIFGDAVYSRACCVTGCACCKWRHLPVQSGGCTVPGHSHDSNTITCVFQISQAGDKLSG